MPEQRWKFKAEQLRIIAEAAAGVPANQVRYIVERGGRLHITERAVAGEIVLLELTGADPQTTPGAPQPEFELELRIKATAVTPAPLPKQLRTGYDAFFWSRAGIRKFVLPYYLPLYGPEKIHELEETLQDSKYLGVLHGDYSPLSLAAYDGTLTSPFYTLEDEGVPLTKAAELSVRPLDDLLSP